MFQLTDHEKSDLMGKLHHYLQDHKYKHKISNQEIAEKMDIDLSELDEMLTGKGYQPLVQAVEVLMTLASLKSKYGQHPGDLLDWLLAKNSEVQSKEKEIADIKGIPLAENEVGEDEKKEAKKKLYDWERSLLHSFDIVGIPLRGRFLAFCEESRRHGGGELKRLLETATAKTSNANTEPKH